ncbi:MAG: P-II family nitrogen regulator [Myxococcaceae bacterium]|nr:P-II family nitrogen regulator [Myxococcaceae bacterium]
MREMELVVAYVRQTRRSAVGQALRQLDQAGWSESQVVGHGSAASGHGVEHVRFEVLTPSAMAEVVSMAIAQAAHTGEKGDGMVFTCPVRTSQHIEASPIESAMQQLAV